MVCLVLLGATTSASEVELPVPLDQLHAPTFLYPCPSNGGVLLTEPDGQTVRFLYRPYPEEGKIDAGSHYEGGGPGVFEDISHDGGRTWTLRQPVFETDFHSNGDVAYPHPETGELYWTHKVGKHDTYLIRSSDGRTKWSDRVKLPFKLRYDTGSFIWLEKKAEQNGTRRMVLATHDGKGVVTWTSDDEGNSWQGPSNRCIAPVVGKGRWGDPGNAGHIVEMKDGRLWMLTRNCQDHLWEYFSDDRGESWGEGQPSRFVGVFSCFRFYRIPDGRLMLVWLNNIPRTTGNKRDNNHNTARDVLHAAISDDEGETWRGFREIALGRRRHELVFHPAYVYDCGIHHPKLTVTSEGKAIVFTGQDFEDAEHDNLHRQAVIFDLDWLYESSHSTDFSKGYDDLSVFKMSKRPWGKTNYYSRTLGATLIEHPTTPFKKVLHLGRETCDWVWNEQDGANWNFPTGKTGILKTRILLRDGFKGGSISLTDTFYPPADNAGEKAAMFTLEIPDDGRIDENMTLAPDRWFELELEWTGTENASTHSCTVRINGHQLSKSLPLKNPSPNGVSYVRLRSTAPDEDLAGWLVESLRATVGPRP
ncbi:MAG: sialidase family protein [Verrucomicrobiota bacterium]